MLGFVSDTGGSHAMHALMLAVDLRREMQVVLQALQRNPPKWLIDSRWLRGANDLDYLATCLNVGEPPSDSEPRRNHVLGILLLCKVLNVRIHLVRLDQLAPPYDLIDVITTAGAQNDPLFKGLLVPSIKTLTVQAYHAHQSSPLAFVSL